MNQTVAQPLLETSSTLCPVSGESVAEEIANSITHGLGFFLSLFGCAYLVTVAILYGSPLLITGCIIYGSSLLLLYGASTCYHCCRSLRAKRVLKVLDHAGIYLLIAGSYTPYTFGPLRGAWGWSLFGIVWGVTVIGMPLKAICLNKCSFLSIAPYLFLGWLCLTATVPLLNNMPGKGFAWLVAGGAVYTVGAVFYLMEKLPFNHAIWHLFVLGGSACHYISIVGYVIPYN